MPLLRLRLVMLCACRLDVEHLTIVWGHLQELLTRHKLLCAEFLERNYDDVKKGGAGQLAVDIRNCF